MSKLRIHCTGRPRLSTNALAALPFSAALRFGPDREPQGYVISPVVEGDQLDIHPLLVFVAALVGASLGGAAGAFVAVPAAAILGIVVREIVVPWRQAQLSGRTTDGTARVGGPEPRVRAGGRASAG